MAHRLDDNTLRRTSDDKTVRPVNDDVSVSGLVDLVKSYVKQELTLPLSGAGRWLGYGLLGALLLGFGVAMLLLGGLRLIQTEWPRAASGSLSWISYGIVLVVCVVAMALAVMRINKPRLNPLDDVSTTDKETD
ncbi:hypothetical protein BH24ACT5_BH24ACT5_31250 [soil metagenome]